MMHAVHLIVLTCHIYASLTWSTTCLWSQTQRFSRTCIIGCWTPYEYNSHQRSHIVCTMFSCQIVFHGMPYVPACPLHACRHLSLRIHWWSLHWLLVSVPVLVLAYAHVTTVRIVHDDTPRKREHVMTREHGAHDV